VPYFSCLPYDAYFPYLLKALIEIIDGRSVQNVFTLLSLFKYEL